MGLPVRERNNFPRSRRSAARSAVISTGRHSSRYFFNACCAVYAPRYRQANGRAFTHPDAKGQPALDLAYSDVERAFERFLAQTDDRPFLIASHSQGTQLAAPWASA